MCSCVVKTKSAKICLNLNLLVGVGGGGEMGVFLCSQN